VVEEAGRERKIVDRKTEADERAPPNAIGLGAGVGNNNNQPRGARCLPRREVVLHHFSTAEAEAASPFAA